MDRCICKGNYVNYVKINMPYDIYFYPISILGNRLIDWENYDYTHFGAATQENEHQL